MSELQIPMKKTIIALIFNWEEEARIQIRKGLELCYSFTVEDNSIPHVIYVLFFIVNYLRRVILYYIAIIMSQGSISKILFSAYVKKLDFGRH